VGIGGGVRSVDGHLSGAYLKLRVGPGCKIAAKIALKPQKLAENFTILG
jgi:hypothetical protein